MPKKSKRAPSADEIAEMATRGENISRCFTNQFKVVRPIHRVNVELPIHTPPAKTVRTKPTSPGEK